MKKLLFVVGAALTAGAAMAQLSFDNSFAGTFTDISATGTALNLGDDGAANFTSTVGNVLLAAGDVRVGNNGGIAFGATNGGLGFTNASLPGSGGLAGVFSDSVPANPQVLLPYWDDLLTPPGNVYWQEIGGTLIISWEDGTRFAGGGVTGRFQVKVYSTGPAFAQFIYDDIQGTGWAGGVSATIGYMDGPSGANTGNNMQWSFNTAGSVSNGTVLSIVPEPGTFLAIGAGIGLLLLRRKRS